MSILFVDKDVHEIVDYDEIMIKELNNYIDSNNEFSWEKILKLNIITGNDYRLRFAKYWLRNNTHFYNIILECSYDDKIIKKYNLIYHSLEKMFYITNVDHEQFYDRLNYNDVKKLKKDLHSKSFPLKYILLYGKDITNELINDVEKLIKDDKK